MDQTTTVERLRVGEDEFREMYPRVRRFAAVVGDRTNDPDDLVQEALARLLRRSEVPEDPERYLRRTIVNLTVDLGRRNTRWVARAPKLFDAVEHRDHYPSELDLLDELDPSQRAVLWLAVVEGWTFDEIGRLLDMKPAAARKQASRARARLLRDQEAKQR